MIINILAIVAALAVVFSLCMALYLWFRVSLSRFDGAIAKEVLSRWDARLAELTEADRAHQRAHPPVEVLEAIVALPPPWSRRFRFSYARCAR
jgi:hypothetical protein